MKKRKPLIFKKAEKALRAVAKRVNDDHRRYGLPLIVWKNGKVVKVAPTKEV